MVEPGRVLIACPTRVERERVAARLDGSGLECRCAESAAQAKALLDGEAFDALLMPMQEESLALASILSDLEGSPAVGLLVEGPSVGEAIEALRRGAADILAHSMGAAEFVDRVRACVGRGRKARARRQRIERLRRVCKQLSTARQEVSKQVGTLCTDLVSAYQELSSQMTTISLAGEFNGLVRQELDLEGLLRSTLEFVLAKAGPTNAAVFLPAPGGDFSLGAYINYDCSKEGGEVLLEHLAGVLAPRVEAEREAVVLAGAAAVLGYLGEGAAWLSDCHMILLPCRHDGECLAVMAIFRDQRTGFSVEATSAVRSISELFAGHLARVIRIHHRHLPRDKWGLIGEGGDDIDLAA